MITNKNTREYEVQLWTLQDSFITVLKSFNIDNFGTIEEPHLELNDDSEDRFTFRLPMYIQNGNEFVENPIWYNVRNGNLIVNLRKIKVIFYRGTGKQRVFEFVITRITESHEGFEKICEVECEGLAFNELGKTGYNIDLSQELYELDVEKGFKTEELIIPQKISIDGNDQYIFIPKNRTTEITQITIEEYKLEIDGSKQSEEEENNDDIIEQQEEQQEESQEQEEQQEEILPEISTIKYDSYNYTPIVLLDNIKEDTQYIIKYTYVPLNNINYWLSKVFTESSPWESRICMNWDDYYGENREPNRIYEDAYIENWKFNEEEDKVIADGVVNIKEKCRIVTESASNRYNLTQNIAETFGVFCRYIYEYDDSLHITNRIVEFYNNAIQEEKEIADFTYYYDTESISRELDSAEQISKMYVLSSSNEDMITSSITEVEANKLLENYLLNFDYLHDTGAIDDEQLDYIIKEFEPKIRDWNLQLRDLSNKITICENSLTKFRGIMDTASVAASEAAEGMENAYARIKALYNATNDSYDGEPVTIPVTGASPDSVVIISEKDKEGNEIKSCKIRQMGVIPSTINVYKTIDNAKNNVDNQKDYCQVVIDEETGFATGLKDITISNLSSSIIYLTYEYSLDLYYKTLGDQWKRKNYEETQKYERYANVVEIINGERDENDELIDPDDGGILKELYDKYDEKLAEKNAELEKFERYLGPAVREGTWTPDDEYAKYGDRRSYSGKFTPTSSFSNTEVSVGWDINTFEDEDKNYEEIFIPATNDTEASTDKLYHPCIKLGTDLWNQIGDFINNPDNEYTLNDIGLVLNEQGLTSYANLPEVYRYPQVFRIGSEAQIAFLQSNSDEDEDEPIVPVLMITGCDTFCNRIQALVKKETGTTLSYTQILAGTSYDSQNPSKKTAYGVSIGVLITKARTDNNNNNIISYEYIVEKINDKELEWIDNEDLEEYKIIYPRIKIPYETFLDNTTDTSLYLGNIELKPFEDYNTMWRYDLGENGDILYDDLDFWENYDEMTDDALSNIKYNAYITINPEVMIRNKVRFGTYQLFYKLSNTGLAIYLDAIKVAKENSIPKVTYNITPIVWNPDFMATLYDKVHAIIHINDYELKFDHVQGYISGVSLNLDSPQDDSIEVKNYTNKFEDMFSSIVAATAAVQKNSGAISASSAGFISTGVIEEKTLQESLDNATISLNLDNSNFIINDSGIKAYSEDGIVYYSPKGIFTATDKKDNGEWNWNTSILPSGISASAIKTGQLDTNLIHIYSGDDLRFQINGDGLFAYKSWFNTELDQNKDYTVVDNDGNAIDGEYKTTVQTDIDNGQKNPNGLDPAQYLQINEDGLFLIAAAGAYIIGDDKIVHLDKDIKRVEVSWDGLILRNNEGKETFFADPGTGNLTISGDIFINGTDTTAELTKEKLRFGPFQLRKEAKIENNETVTESLTFIYVQE